MVVTTAAAPEMVMVAAVEVLAMGVGVEVPVVAAAPVAVVVAGVDPGLAEVTSQPDGDRFGGGAGQAGPASNSSASIIEGDADVEMMRVRRNPARDSNVSHSVRVRSRPVVRASISMSRSRIKLLRAVGSTTPSMSSNFAPRGALACRFFRIEIDSASDQSWSTVIIM